MAVTSNRSITITETGDVEYTQSFSAVVNPDGSGQNQLVNLIAGNNTITVPDDAIAVTIIPADDNDETLVLKGINGDTGINLSMTDPTSIGLDAVASFVLNAGDAITVRLIFS